MLGSHSYSRGSQHFTGCHRVATRLNAIWVVPGISLGDLSMGQTSLGNLSVIQASFGQSIVKYDLVISQLINSQSMICLRVANRLNAIWRVVGQNIHSPSFLVR